MIFEIFGICIVIYLLFFFNMSKDTLQVAKKNTKSYKYFMINDYYKIKQFLNIKHEKNLKELKTYNLYRNAYKKLYFKYQTMGLQKRKEMGYGQELEQFLEIYFDIFIIKYQAFLKEQKKLLISENKIKSKKVITENQLKEPSEKLSILTPHIKEVLPKNKIIKIENGKIVNNLINFFGEYQVINFEKNGYKYNYFIKYYPKRYEVNYEDNNNRNLIYQFKDGGNSNYYIDLISTFIYNKYKNNKDMLLIPIPASTKFKNERRYSYLLSQISQKTGIINGYSAIEIINDREASHLNKNKVIDSVNYVIDETKIKGKNIIILDDIITSGKGFITLSKELEKLGAKTIEGLFLGKTQSDLDYNNDYCTKN